MKLAILITSFLFALGVAPGAPAVEPLVASWQLEHQELNGEKKEAEQLILRITQDSDKYLFAFSVPINNISFVSLSYTAKLDGSDADVKNARGTKVGTVQVTKTSPSHYKLILKGDNKPETTVLLTVSPDGNTLTSDSDSSQAGHPAHLIQTFSKH
jgi:WD40 repeat protein